MLIKILAGLSALFMLCSCSAVSLSGTESLLVAPKLNKRQAEVSQALESTLLLRDIIYEYPQSGQYRSPFIFFDFDGDSREEAVVFYSYAGDADSKVRAKIMSQNADGTWTPLYDVPSQQSKVDFVRFEKLLDTESHCMLIGWQGTGQRLSTLEIYSLKNGAFQLEANPEYRNYSVHDFDGDELSEIAVIGHDRQYDRFFISLLRASSGRIEPAGQLDLAPDIDSTLMLTCGKLWDGSGAVYIDEILGDGSSPTTATEIVRVSKSGLSLLCGGDAVASDEPESLERNNYEVTFRDESILCMDIDSDGVVEVPYPVSLPGSYENVEAGIPKLVQLMHLKQEGFDVQSSAVINTEAGYLVYFPDRWKEKVTVEFTRETSEWHFKKWNPDTMEPAEELLRIRASSSKDGESDIFYKDYVTLASKGIFSYTAYIPELPGEDLAVTGQEVNSMFQLLPS